MKIKSDRALCERLTSQVDGWLFEEAEAAHCGHTGTIVDVVDDGFEVEFEGGDKQEYVTAAVEVGVRDVYRAAVRFRCQLF